MGTVEPAQELWREGWAGRYVERDCARGGGGGEDARTNVWKTGERREKGTTSRHVDRGGRDNPPFPSPKLARVTIA